MRNAQRFQSAFTLIELLITLSVIAVLAAITVPMIGAIGRMSRGQAGEAAIATAVSAARVLNHRLHAGPTQVNLPDGTPLFSSPFHGTAILFTPEKSVRFLIHNPRAAHVYPPSGATDYLEKVSGGPSYGYRDIEELNDLTLPSSAHIVGILPDRTGADRYVLPPFAIRFNAEGQMSLDEAHLIYDADANDVYEKDDDRDSYANVSDSDALEDVDEAAKADILSDTLKRELPFEQIEVVSAIILFDRKAFEASPIPNLQDWLEDDESQEHCKPLFFSPQTGLIIKE